jgi:hypothetical protein
VNLGTVFSGLTSAAEVVKAVQSVLKRSRGTKRALLLELQRNIELAFLYTDCGAPIEKVVSRLEVASYENAVRSNFNFNTLQRDKISDKTLLDLPQYRSYTGRSTEDLFQQIYLKIYALKTIVEIDPKNRRFRKGVRLINILKMMLLLLRHLMG